MLSGKMVLAETLSDILVAEHTAHLREDTTAIPPPCVWTLSVLSRSPGGGMGRCQSTGHIPAFGFSPRAPQPAPVPDAVSWWPACGAQPGEHTARGAQSPAAESRREAPDRLHTPQHSAPRLRTTKGLVALSPLLLGLELPEVAPKLAEQLLLRRKKDPFLLHRHNTHLHNCIGHLLGARPRGDGLERDLTQNWPKGQRPGRSDCGHKVWNRMA